MARSQMVGKCLNKLKNIVSEKFMYIFIKPIVHTEYRHEVEA